MLPLETKQSGEIERWRALEYGNELSGSIKCGEFLD
jgi:hypothetical protein